MMSKAIATLEGTCLSLDPDIKIVEYLKPFVEKYMTPVPSWDDVVKQLKTGPFELQKLRRLIVKHGVKALHLIENPTFRIASEEFRNLTREMDKASVNISYGFIVASLIVFAASFSNEFETWLKTHIHTPEPLMPLLPIISLGFASYLLIRLYLRNRPKKRLRTAGR
jgi:predicted unusual protein kinase regulating ubiquinone biosynthesis (AarF/ABC1/UbiB family)